jgi:hypothetical protein
MILCLSMILKKLLFGPFGQQESNNATLSKPAYAKEREVASIWLDECPPFLFPFV